MLYTLRFFFSSKCSLFHNANLFGSCIIHILYTVCAKIKKNNSGAKGLIRYDCHTKLQSHALRFAVLGTFLDNYDFIESNLGFSVSNKLKSI